MVYNSIIDNTSLSLGAKSFLLKIAAFSDQEQCYDFLHHINAKVNSEVPGYTREVFTTIKLINDLCNNTPTMRDGVITTSRAKFFAIIASYSYDITDHKTVQKALQDLIVGHLKHIGDSATHTIGLEEYRNQQLQVANDLNSQPSIPQWMFFSDDITPSQKKSNFYTRDMEARL